MHRISRHIVAAAVFLIAAVTVSAIPARPVPERLVNDFAGILDFQQKTGLELMLDIFSDTTSNQIAVVTVDDLEGYSPAEYGTEIGIEWPRLEGEYKGTASAEGYSVDGVGLNLSDKDQKWLGLKDTFKL